MQTLAGRRKKINLKLFFCLHNGECIQDPRTLLGCDDCSGDGWGTLTRSTWTSVIEWRRTWPVSMNRSYETSQRKWTEQSSLACTPKRSEASVPVNGNYSLRFQS